MEEGFRFADELGRSSLFTFTVPLSVSRRSSPSTTSPADQQLAVCAWRRMSAPRKPSGWRGR